MMKVMVNGMDSSGNTTDKIDDRLIGMPNGTTNQEKFRSIESCERTF